jgi:23S rRNA (adenine2503-C2)-methyltransferase
MKPVAYGLDTDNWKKWMNQQDQPSWRAEQVMNWLFQKRITDFNEMTNLPRDLRLRLADTFTLDPLEPLEVQTSRDGTVKFLFGLRDGHAIETVIMRHRYGNSVCVTTQVGCRIGCTFCASTLGGLKRNLEAGEIVAQVVAAQRYLDQEGERVRTVVVMGSGEPFENYEETMRFIRVINDPEGLRIGQRHITVSTSGVVPNIRRFAEEGLQVGLAVSLHAPNDELRSKLMPINRRYPLPELMDACWYYLDMTGRRITFEYALIGDRNDGEEHAHELGKLLSGMNCLVNLIPVNFVPERNLQRTPREHGSDIDAACGQLRAKRIGVL